MICYAYSGGRFVGCGAGGGGGGGGGGGVIGWAVVTYQMHVYSWDHIGTGPARASY